MFGAGHTTGAGMIGTLGATRIHARSTLLSATRAGRVSRCSMRILQIASSYPVDETDATAPFVRSIARALAADGHELQIIVPWRDNMPAKTFEPGITVHWVSYAPLAWLNVIGHGRSLVSDTRLRLATFAALPLFLIAAWVRAAEIVRIWKPDVAHSHWVLPGGLIGAVIARLARIPHAVNLHGSDIYIANSRRLYQTIARWVFRNTRHVFACSPFLAEKAVLLGADPGRTHFLPHGVDSANFKARERFQRDGDSLIVLAAGRLVEKKGFRALVENAEVFLGSHPTAQLWIAGDGDDKSLLERAIASKQARTGQRMHLLGRVPWSRMPELLRKADLFAMPSISDSHGNQDGLPTVVLEAMSCGAAVVTSDVGGAGSVIEDGVSGIVVPSGDAIQFARAINELLSDRARIEQISLAGSEAVRTRYTWAAVAQQMERAFHG